MMVTAKDLPQIGTIAQVHGPVVDISCAVLPPLHRALLSRLDHETYTFEAHQHLDETHVRAITLHRTAGLRRGMPVFDTGSSLHVPVSPDCLSRLLNLFGDPLDGKPPLASEIYRNIITKPAPLHRAKTAAEKPDCSAALESVRPCSSWSSCTRLLNSIKESRFLLASVNGSARATSFGAKCRMLVLWRTL